MVCPPLYSECTLSGRGSRRQRIRRFRAGQHGPARNQGGIVLSVTMLGSSPPFIGRDSLGQGLFLVEQPGACRAGRNTGIVAIMLGKIREYFLELSLVLLQGIADPGADQSMRFRGQDPGFGFERGCLFGPDSRCL